MSKAEKFKCDCLNYCGDDPWLKDALNAVSEGDIDLAKDADGCVIKATPGISRYQRQ